MSKQIPVPAELQHLIEKRQQEKDRRKKDASPVQPERRQKSDRRRKRKSGS
jgi:hypothetical protein